ncbi:M14 family zinc carboxypeptidase [Marinobacter shengliensis]|uniref:M14 family zinc carboxypeptidase n=1 Tax=Marinobacter shengliensis TaxID=1389223 RepID=UPI001E361AFF|nr:M14 family zinc carboxypeptidase [Marinobacter shengliensis]MCD1628445.1 hypothetical protein [Marinobacter shengliensis]
MEQVTNFQYSHISGTDLRMTWDAVTGATSYDVTVSKNNAVVTALTVSTPEVVSYSVTVGELYEVSIVASDGTESGEQVKFVVYLSTAQVLPPVTNLQYTELLTQDGMSVTWDPSANATGYRMIVTDLSGTVIFDGPAVSPMVVTGLQIATVYKVEVRPTLTGSEGFGAHLLGWVAPTFDTSINAFTAHKAQPAFIRGDQAQVPNIVTYTEKAPFEIPSQVQTNGYFVGDTLLKEALAFETKAPISHTFSDTTPVPTYAEIQADIDALVADFPDIIVKDLMGHSVNGLPIYGLRILDDGLKPIVGFSNGIHGDERNAHGGIVHAIRHLLTDPGPVATAVREKLTLFFAPTISPDGMSSPAVSENPGYSNTGLRLNINNVDLNDDWPYYWKYSIKERTGLTPSSQPETYHFQDWFSTYAPNKRCIGWIDCHGWSSRTEFGWLTEQIYHNDLAQCAQRAAYLYTAHLMEAQDYETNFPAGYQAGVRPQLREFRSARKPYIYTWVKQLSADVSFCGLIESPQIECPGMHCVFAMDMVLGSCLAGLDIVEGGIAAVTLPAVAEPINQNSRFDAFDEVDNRPQFFSKENIALTYFPESLTEPAFIRSSRLPEDAWPKKVIAGAACCLNYDGVPDANIGDGSDYVDQELSDVAISGVDSFFVIGGIGNTGRSPSSHGEALFFDDSRIFGASLPEGLQHGAAASDGQYMYHFGGYGDSGYHSTIYKASARPPGSWTVAGSMSEGLQRHTVDYWKDGKFVYALGRSSASYKNSVYVWNSATDTEEFIASLPASFGWHCSTIRNDILWIFGGWTGGSTREEVYKVDLVAKTVTAATPLPFSRAEMAIGVRGDKAYLFLGRTGSATLVNKIFEYDMATEQVTDLNYTLGKYEIDDNGTMATIPQPLRISASAYGHPTIEKCVIVGGQDELGAATSSVYEFDTQTHVLSLRPASEATWGFLRSNEVFYGKAGDKFSVVAELRNPLAVNVRKAVYGRITIIVGPLSNPSRTVRLGYMVPPQDTFRPYALPLELLEGESEFRVYVRHYGNNTDLDIASVQVFRGNDVIWSRYPNTLDIDGQAYARPLVNVSNTKEMNQSITGVISPHTGTQRTSLRQFIRWEFSDVIENMVLSYRSIQDFSEPDDPSKPMTLQAFKPNGKFILSWLENGVQKSVEFFHALELNHATINREWRRDRLSWKLTMLNEASTGVGDLELTFSFYGKTHVVLIPLDTAVTCQRVWYSVAQTVRESRVAP